MGMEQEMDAHRKYNEFVRQQREIWTPRNIFDRCCVKWLANGKEEQQQYGFDSQYGFSFEDELNDGNVVGKGCDYCRKDHPRILLIFQHNMTVAKLSHLLDPFINYMKEGVKNGSASRISDGTYHLHGSVRENVHKLCSQTAFGKHLVSLARGSLKASDKFQLAKRDLLAVKGSPEGGDDTENDDYIILNNAMEKQLGPINKYEAVAGTKRALEHNNDHSTKS